MKRPIKIGFYSEVLNKVQTGIGRYASNIAQNLMHLYPKDLEFTYINSKIDTHIQVNQIRIPNYFPKFETYPWYLTTPLLLRNKSIDIIHNPTQIPTFFPFKQKNIITVHDITPHLYPNEHPCLIPPYNKLFLRRSLINADAIIADSKNTKSDLITHLKIPKEKIIPIYLGVEEKFSPALHKEAADVREKFGLPDTFILYVGTLEPRKNLPVLLKACSLLKKQNWQIPLVIAGKKGWLYDKIFKTVRELTLTQNIIFTGYIPDMYLPSLYSAATLFVYPSLYEGFGFPPLEAMACGCPVITSDRSSLPEIVGNAGITIPPDNPQILADEILRIWEDEDIRTELKNKGINRSKEFTWSACAKQTYEIYQQVLES